MFGRGYFDLVVSAAAGTSVTSSFAVVADPETRRVRPDSFFAVDAALSWVNAPGAFRCPWNGGDAFGAAIEAMRLAGLRHVRERMGWQEVQPQSEQEPSYGHYLDNARRLARNGQFIAGMYHDAPKWARRSDGLPDDLLAVYRFAEKTARVFGETAASWEFWNEEDVGFASGSAWTYAAALKAAALGFRAGNPKAIVMNGAFCQWPLGVYHDTVFASELAPYVDVLNVHTYRPLVEAPAMGRSASDFLRRHGMAGRAVWMTENGTNAEGLAEENSVRTDVRQHSRRQDLILAEFYPKSQFALRMAGFSRNFHFVFGAFNEQGGRKDWGVLRRDGTVKPIYSAIATLTHELSESELEGEVSLGKEVCAYVCRLPSGSRTLVVWRLSELDRTGGVVKDFSAPPVCVRLPLAPGAYEVVDLCGRSGSIRATEDGAVIALDRYPQYVHDVGALACVRKPPAKGNGRAVVPDGLDASVVLRVEPNAEDFGLGAGRSRAELKKNRGRLRVFVWNLSGEKKTGFLAEKSGAVDGLPKRMALPAWGMTSVDLIYRPPNDADYEQPPLVFGGRFGGRRVSRAVVPVGNLSGLLKLPCMTLATKERDNWRRNDSADSFACTWDDDEQAIRFDFSWMSEKNNRWFYPVYALRPEEDVTGSAMLVFEAKSLQDKVENDYDYAFVMASAQDRNGRSVDIPWIPCRAPGMAWEGRQVDLGAVLGSGTNALHLTSLRFGGNPRGHKVSYFIRNVKIFSAAKGKE